MLRLYGVITTTLILLVAGGAANGQGSKLNFLVVETGYDFQGCESPEYSFVRAKASYYDAYGARTLYPFHDKFQASVKAERLWSEKKLAISTGIRISAVTAELTQNWYSDGGYFYILYDEQGTTTEYLRVKRVSQRSWYVGVPIDVKYYLFNTIQPRWYVKAGLDMGFRIKYTDEVRMHDPEMDLYEESVAGMFEQPGKFLSSVYVAAGVRLGNIEKLSFSLEAVLPSVILSRNKAGMVTPIAGGGFQMSVQRKIQ